MKAETHEIALVCPFCGKQQDRAFCAFPDQGPPIPQDGDVALCFNCGELTVVSKGELRKPTDAEYERLATDESVVKARAAWVEVDKGRREKPKAQTERPKKVPMDSPIDEILDSGFERSFEAMFTVNGMPPELKKLLKRGYMAGVLTCFGRLSKLGSIEDEKEARTRWLALKSEIAEFCVETILTPPSTKE
jgi:hypothetical protein